MQVLLAAPVGRSRAMTVQGKDFGVRISRYVNPCPMRIEEWLYYLGKQVPGWYWTWGTCRSPLIRTEQVVSSQHVWPCPFVHLQGEFGWGGQVSTCPGPSGWRRGVCSLCLDQRHREHLPRSSGLLSERWGLHLLVFNGGDLRKPEWVHLVVSSERGGVAGGYVLSPGTLEMTWHCPVTCCLSKTTFAAGLWSRWRL